MRHAFLIVSCAAPAMAQDFLLELPLDCEPGVTCYIQNYVDHDPSEAATDFRCGSLTYDTHQGTDFGLPSLAAMNAGVNVTASAAGIVRGMRNDMRDVMYTTVLADEINGRDCGNGVVIAHADGWETQYCHMMQGSVSVSIGQDIEAGDILGQVGLSGRTQFPHVHISVRRDGQVIDPFDPDDDAFCNATPGETLWADPLDTPAGGLLSVGFADEVPDYDNVKAGTAAAPFLTLDAPVVLWGFAFGARVGDVVTLEITGPDGALFETDDVLTRIQALFMRAGGLNPPDAGWARGQYTGRVTHTRDERILSQKTVDIDMR